ncbi:MAG: hypothetical protein JSS29_18585 [Proteobacteria bacterium]|nr:hypothetical protein [Pseudomonadota bacterium]
MPPIDASSPQSPSPLVRGFLGVILAGLGIYLLGIDSGVIPFHRSLEGSRVFVGCLGVMLACTGIQVGQWAGASGRLPEAVGSMIITAMAVLFGWVTFFGDSRGFSSSLSVGGLSVTSHGSALVPRIAFGIGATLMALFAAYAWSRVLRPRN